MIGLFGAAVLIIATVGGMAGWNPAPADGGSLKIALILFVFPALGEELLFRGLLHPSKNASNRIPKMAAIIGLFILWHVAQAVSGIGPAWASVFLEPTFLTCVAMLGVGLAALREMTGSLWPSVLCHWAVVAGWKLLFDGPIGPP